MAVARERAEFDKASGINVFREFFRVMDYVQRGHLVHRRISREG